MTTQPEGAKSGQKCLPTYAVLDTSASMRPFEKVLNETLERVYEGLYYHKAVAEFAHVSIISFNSNAHVVLPLTDISKIDALPELTCRGSTNYSEAFRVVAAQIDADVNALRAQGRPVLRPAVFFITDGQPMDDSGVWEGEFAKLTSPSWPRRPHVITFGFGDAAEHVLARIATKAAFKAQAGVEQQEALVNVLLTLLNSLVASAQHEKLMIPTEVEGYKSVPLEYID
ncbi:MULTISPECIES: vWA domain-containing protein [Pseudofrankia]|uniref:vWA domain-containing protein n=1 Tax=Pseudofrankia TaxID=2994363 RepID=UPI000234D727|nr:MULTISPECIES: VWA domain-containing protein [Pseudofrankia]OHV35233.1 VWA domain-containing protein [Pseudofrankia sp. EUN1h]